MAARFAVWILELTQATLLPNFGLIEARLLVVVYLVAPGAGQRDNFLRSKEFALHSLCVGVCVWKER